MNKAISLAFLLSLCIAVGIAEARADVRLVLQDTQATLDNGYVRVELSSAPPRIVAIHADFDGNGNFSTSVLAKPFEFLRHNASGFVESSIAAALFVQQNTSDIVTVQLAGVVDGADVKSATANETWTISLAKSSRTVSITLEGKVIQQQQRGTLLHSLGFAATSIYALFSRGVVQMRGYDKGGIFPSNDTAGRIYALGGGSSVDLDLSQADTTAGIVLNSNVVSTPSGLELIVAGDTPQKENKWDGVLGWSLTANRGYAPGSTWNDTLLLSVSDRNFPAGGLDPTQSNLPSRDLEALLTGVFGSSPGCLCTFDNEVKDGERVAQIATTIARPDRGYSGTYNYFDPDNFISLTSILYTGDAYLQDQARQVIERSGAFLKPNGQLPHHFKDDQPQYTALSGATQTGPNTFWVKTGLNYARVTGNTTWLHNYMPTLRSAANFCFNLIDSESHMLKAPGSLMIDVFVRENFTSDSNAMMVGFLREFAGAEEFVGNVTGAAMLREMASNMAVAVNAKLWAAPGVGRGGDDHYITQLNPDNTTRDFVDYDSNLIAVAHNIPDDDRALRVLKRVDGGKCAAVSGGGPTFVSEIYYDKDNCVGGNVGDSFCSMARIGYYDAYSRRRLGQQDVFDDKLLAPLITYLIKNTWMHERLACDGSEQMNRTEAYFEYPATVGMLLREIRYGINIDFSNVTVAPFGPTDFHYHIGDLDVDYTSTAVSIGAPGGTKKTYTIEGLKPSTSFQLSATGCSLSGTVASDAKGTLVFQGPSGVGCVVTASAAGI